jgi:hypothetical protein
MITSLSILVLIGVFLFVGCVLASNNKWILLSFVSLLYLALLGMSYYQFNYRNAVKYLLKNNEFKILGNKVINVTSSIDGDVCKYVARIPENTAILKDGFEIKLYWDVEILDQTYFLGDHNESHAFFIVLKWDGRNISEVDKTKNLENSKIKYTIKKLDSDSKLMRCEYELGVMKKVKNDNQELRRFRINIEMRKSGTDTTIEENRDANQF